jgi:hypothetical protein
MLELDTPTCLVPAQGTRERQIIQNGRVSTFEFAERETVLERCLPFAQAQQKPLHARLALGPVQPEPVRDVGQ